MTLWLLCIFLNYTLHALHAVTLQAQYLNEREREHALRERERERERI